MLVTLLGIVIDAKLEQPAKARSPIVITLSGMVIDAKPEQSRNAPSPILVMLLGMIVFWQPLINVFVFVSIIALQLSRLSYIGLPFSTKIDIKAGQ